MIFLLNASETARGTQIEYVEMQVAILALVVAFASFIVSLLSVLQNRKINTTNLEAKYFEETFRDYIVNRMPECVAKLQFIDGKLSGSYKELNNLMMEMIRDARYYAYAKRDFYLKLQEMTQNLEDRLMIQANECIINTDLQVEFIYSIHVDIMNIIKFINKNYHHF